MYIECKVEVSYQGLEIIYSKTDSVCRRPSCRSIDQQPADCNKSIRGLLRQQFIINSLNINLYLHSKLFQRTIVLPIYCIKEIKKKSLGVPRPLRSIENRSLSPLNDTLLMGLSIRFIGPGRFVQSQADWR